MSHSTKAILFDVDGTMYDAKGLRRKMFLQILNTYKFEPKKLKLVIRCLNEYRQAHEYVRLHIQGGLTADLQIGLAAHSAEVSEYQMQAIVTEWMEEAPLKHLHHFRYPELVEALDCLSMLEYRLGVVSDYPATKKLEAMGIDGYFDTVICAQREDVNVFKPSPTGIHLALSVLGVQPEEALFVGDREDVDEKAANRAGVEYYPISHNKYQACKDFHWLKQTYSARAGQYQH